MSPATFFFTSTGQAYDASQTDPDIQDGDVLAVPAEGVYGFVLEAWPTAIITGVDGPGEFGEFATAKSAAPARAAYAASIREAIAVAEEVSGR